MTTEIFMCLFVSTVKTTALPACVIQQVTVKLTLLNTPANMWERESNFITDTSILEPIMKLSGIPCKKENCFRVIPGNELPTVFRKRGSMKPNQWNLTEKETCTLLLGHLP